MVKNGVKLLNYSIINSLHHKEPKNNIELNSSIKAIDLDLIKTKTKLLYKYIINSVLNGKLLKNIFQTELLA